MPWAVAAAGVGAVGSLASGAMASGATKSAQDSANAASAAAREQARADLAPWRTTGENALTVAGDLSGANGVEAANAAAANFQTSPGYQWQLSEGLRGVDAGAAAKGMLRSGATLKGEMEYSQGLAKQDFASYYNRLADLSSLGEKAAAGQADASMNTGRDIAKTDLSTGANQASIYGNTGQGVTSALTDALGTKGVQNSLTSLFGGGGGSSGGSNMWIQS